MTAAQGPCISSSRKMKTSPATKEFFEPGMRTGKKPATTASAPPATICASTGQGRAWTCQAATSSATLPIKNIVHQ